MQPFHSRNARSNNNQRDQGEVVLNKLCFHVGFVWYTEQRSDAPVSFALGFSWFCVRQSKLIPHPRASEGTEITGDEN